MYLLLVSKQQLDGSMGTFVGLAASCASNSWTSELDAYPDFFIGDEYHRSTERWPIITVDLPLGEERVLDIAIWRRPDANRQGFDVLSGSGDDDDLTPDLCKPELVSASKSLEGALVVFTTLEATQP
jgi:hypothetical protein